MKVKDINVGSKVILVNSTTINPAFKIIGTVLNIVNDSKLNTPIYVIRYIPCKTLGITNDTVVCTKDEIRIYDAAKDMPYKEKDTVYYINRPYFINNEPYKELIDNKNKIYYNTIVFINYSDHPEDYGVLKQLPISALYPKKKETDKKKTILDIVKNHIGISLYSPIWGNCTLVDIHDNMIKVRVDISSNCRNVTYDGYLESAYRKSGEVILFPSKDNRDWEEFDKQINKQIYYWYIDECGNLVYVEDTNSNIDIKRKESNNYFIDEDVALDRQRKIKEILNN